MESYKKFIEKLKEARLETEKQETIDINKIYIGREKLGGGMQNISK